MARKRTIHAINDGLSEEMERDDRVILIGEDVGASVFGDTRGLLQKFGPARVRNMPLSEAAMTGMAVGAAATGLRPVCHLMYGNFVYTGFDAIANQAAKLRLMTGGRIRLPIVFMAVIGGGVSNAAQHSDSPHPALMNLGGLVVLMPTNPADAKGLLKAAIRSDDPVIFLQAASRTGDFGEVPDGDVLVPLGRAAVARPGNDATVVAIGSMMRPARDAAEQLSARGINVEILDPRTLFPLDQEAIARSVNRTGRLVIVDEARDTCSAASHIAAIAAEKCFGALRGPIRRLTVPDIPMPFSPPLEKALLPDAGRIVTVVSELCGACVQ